MSENKTDPLKNQSRQGKILLEEGASEIVGQIISPAASSDRRRELSIEVHDDEVVDRLHNIVQHDWNHSRPMDLSDQGLMADLENRIEGGAELLALNDTRRRDR